MKERVKKIDYAEVDSDVDLDEEEREVERMKQQQLNQVNNNNNNKGKKGGGTFGTTNNNKKKKRKMKVDKSDGPSYNSKLLLDLPFDLFAEVCSHLEGKDLLALAKVNTTIRNLLLSRSSRSIWSALRRKLGYPLPAGFNELDFALFEYSKICQVSLARLFVEQLQHVELELKGYPLPTGFNELDFALFEYSKICQMCGSRVKHEELTAHLRKRFCHKCYLSQTISSKGLKSAWPDLHPAATQCVRSIDKGPTWMGNSSATRCLTSDLNAVDAELKELEEQDELAVSLLENQAFKGSSTRSRRSNNNAEVLEANHVENFIKAKQVWVKSEQQTSKQITKIRERRRQDPAREREALRKAARDARNAILQSLEDDHDWQSDEADYLRRWNMFESLAPRISIEEDPEAWSKCRQLVRTTVDNEISRRIKEQASYARRGRVLPYYDSLKISESGTRDVFPRILEFFEFTSIKPLWEPENAIINDEIWEQIQPALKEELDKYEEKGRVEAIRAILAANQGLSSTSSLSKNPLDYPESIYNDNFFSQMTSRFRSSSRGSTYSLDPYPSAVRRYYLHNINSLERRIDPRQILIIRSLSKAAGLNPETASFSDFDDLGSAFVWVNDPRQSYRKRKIKRSFLEMLDHALRKGPSQRKIAQGERFEFEYRPDLDKDDEDEDSQPSDTDAEDEEEEEKEGGEDEPDEGDGTASDEQGSDQEEQSEED
ncbi:hypothetical protein JCM3765_001621 [Sporobolomyces pararoseus]